MSFRVFESEDATNGASTAIAKKTGSAVRVTNTTAATICTVKWGEDDTVVAVAGDIAIGPGQDAILAIPAGAQYLAVLCPAGRVNLAWGADGLG
jgi:hypothetical protein